MKIRYKFPLILAPVLILALLYFSTVWFNLTKENFDSHLKSELKAITLKKTSQIGGILEKAENDLAILSAGPLLKEGMDLYYRFGPRGGKSGHEGELLEDFVLTFLKKSRVYESFSLIDDRGNELVRIFSVPSPYTLVNVEDKEYFSQTLSYPEGVILKFFEKDGTGIIYATPVQSTSAKGVAVLTINYALLQGAIKEPASEQIADVFLLDGEGNFIVEIFNTGKMSENFRTTLGALIATEHPSLHDTESFIKHREEESEEKYVFARSPVNYFNWTVIGLYKYSEFTEEMSKLRNRTLLISAGVIVFALILMVVVTQRLVFPLGTLTEKVQHLKEGQWEKVESSFPNDEIGSLTVKFNEMIDSIKEKQTTIQKAYQKLKEQQDIIIMKEKLAAIGELSAGVAHEINNPLNNILGYLSLLKKKKKFTKDEKKQFKIIEEQIYRVTRIVEGLLDFSRQRKPVKETVEVNEILSDAVSQVEKDLKCGFGKINPVLPRERVTAHIDKDQIWRVFYNIIKNAVEATDEEGKVGVTLEKTGDSKIKIKVKDTGMGISRKNLDKIFVPFFTTKAERAGTGLGLAIAMGIIQDHAGNISVESVKGKGTVFCIILPRKG